MEYLRLLARDAPATEYDLPLQAARAEGLSAERVGELEDARGLALEIRATLTRKQRRETALTALFETAGDLAALRELDAVLNAIVSRAHSLVGADVAYLTLSDPECGDTYMRVTHGSVSAHFQSLRLPEGVGLGGLVAQTAKPYVTADYRHDARFRHSGDIESAVVEEGLIAILGVPLVLGSRAIGVLFVANRTSRPFARDEVALLSSLAAHAAVAIDSARLLQATRDALVELSTANRLVREHSDSVERAAAVHDALADLVLKGTDVESIATAVGRALGGRLAVLDVDGCVVATADSTGSADSVGSSASEGCEAMPDIPAEALAELITISTETGRAARSERHMVAAITAAAEPFGAIVVTRDPASDAELRDTDQRILERAALVLALHLLIKRSAAEAAERLGGDLLDDLLAVPLRHVSTLVERARRVGADLERPHVVVVVDLGPNDRSRSGFTAGRLAAAKGGLAGPHEGRLVLLLPGDDAAGAAQEVLGWFKDPRSVRITVGAGSPRASVAEFADGYAEAVRCLNALHALGRTGHAAALTDLGFVGLILGGVDPHQVVRRAIGPLIDYDAKRGTDLVGTVETYLFSGRSLGRTSAALHIHVNTVTQRLERVGRLLGADWQEPAKSLEVHLALQLRRVLTADPYGGQEWRDAR